MNTAVCIRKYAYLLIITDITLHVRLNFNVRLNTVTTACDDPSGGRRPAQIPRLDTAQASQESHNSIHNPL